MQGLLLVATIVVGLSVALSLGVALTYAVLVGLGRRRGQPSPVPAIWPHLGVLIPAHNEAKSIGPTLESLASVAYPEGLLTVLVVADNCDDETAEVARGWGVGVLERHDSTNRGKGYALQRGCESLLGQNVDGVIILDADCDLPPNALVELGADLMAGHQAVQCARMPRHPETLSASSVVALAGSWIENAFSMGRSRLGLSVPLRGSGMLFGRATLQAHPWQAYGLVEDAEYGDRLTRAGVPIRFRPDLVVQGEVPADAAVLARQRARWNVSLHSGGIMRRLERHLASKPLVLAQLTLSVVLVLALVLIQPNAISATLAGLAVLSLLLTATVYWPALRAAGACGA